MLMAYCTNENVDKIFLLYQAATCLGCCQNQ